MKRSPTSGGVSLELRILLLAGALLGSPFLQAQNLYVGSNSSGQITNFTSGTNSYSSIYVGLNSTDSNNLLTVSNTGTLLSNSASLYVGDGGGGNEMIISAGGQVKSSPNGYIGFTNTSSNNSILVTGSNSLWSNGTSLYVGYYGSGNSLTISNAGTVRDPSGYIGGNSGSGSNTVLVTGSNSLWSNGSALYVGDLGSGNSLTISNAGTVISGTGYIGYSSHSNTVLVTGSNSLWSNSGSLLIGGSGSGNGTLTVANGGTVAAKTIIIANTGGTAGTLNIGSLGGGDSAGTINASTITFGSGTGSINFNQTNSTTLSSAISGKGSVNQLGSGTTILSGSNSYTGTTTVSAGTLNITGQLVSASNSVIVTNSGTLGGTGTIAGPVTNASGGTLAPGVGGSGTLTIKNSLVLASNSTTTFSLGGTNYFTSINIGTNNLTYGGVLVFNLTDSYADAAGDTFDLFGPSVTSLTETGTASLVELTGNITGYLINDGTGNWNYTTNGLTFTFGQSSGVLGVSSAVPEPATSALIGLCALALAIACRRRTS